MSKKINVVTGNRGKVNLVQDHISPYGFQAAQVDLPIVEPQANSVEAVALSKAAQAFRMLHEPLVVEDSGFYIHDLSGFPGPYTKYVIETIGVAGLLYLALPLASRSCGFLSVLVFVDQNGQSHTFMDSADGGFLATEIDQTPCEDCWSDLWRIFIPVGYS
jgi:non-canonical purine NTP pyrophosphatase (RdgB/HAM1 family)